MNECERAKRTLLDGCSQHIRDTYSFLRGKRIYIYGAGKYGQFLGRALVEFGCVNGEAVSALIDDFHHGYEVDVGWGSLPVIPLEACDVSGDGYCVVVAIRNREWILEKLKSKGIRHFAGPLWEIDSVVVTMSGIWRDTEGNNEVGNMLVRIDKFHEMPLSQKQWGEWWNDQESLEVFRNRMELYSTGRLELLQTACPNPTPEYFSHDLLNIGTEEYYVDCGAYTGDSVRDFVAFVKGQYKGIIAFEPNPLTFRELKRLVEGMPCADAVEAATGNHDGTLRCSEGFSTATAATASGPLEVREVRLDDFLHGPVTFVKMDIEGAELDTLMGMERILREQHPKLAVCLYHRVSHLFDVPKYLKSIVPEYRLKLRQHQATIYETVLYAEV